MALRWQTLRPTEGLETYFKVSLLLGAILAMPVILVQFLVVHCTGIDEGRAAIYLCLCSECPGPFCSGDGVCVVCAGACCNLFPGEFYAGRIYHGMDESGIC